MLKLILLALATGGTPHGDSIHAEDMTSRSVEFLGLRFCAGPQATSGCDVHVFTHAPTSTKSTADMKPARLKMSLLGRTVCVGAVPDATGCDVRLGTEVAGA